MIGQALLDNISHAELGRVERALGGLQQHTMAVAILYASNTTITAEVTSIKVKRNRKKETRIERDTYSTCVSVVGNSCSCPDFSYRNVGLCKHAIAAALVVDDAYAGTGKT